MIPFLIPLLYGANCEKVSRPDENPDEVFAECATVDGMESRGRHHPVSDLTGVLAFPCPLRSGSWAMGISGLCPSLKYMEGGRGVPAGIGHLLIVSLLLRILREVCWKFMLSVGAVDQKSGEGTGSGQARGCCRRALGVGPPGIV